MPKKISPEMKARAVRMVLEHRDDYPSVRAAAQAVAKQLGLGPETVRRWVVDAEVDAWDPAGNHDRRAGRDQGPQGEDPPARGGQPDPACQRQAHLDPALCRQGVSFHVPSTPRRDHRCDSGLGVSGHRGLSSAFFRRPVFFKEMQCSTCGHAHCLIEGRFQHEWPDGEQIARDYDPDSMLVRLDELQSQVEALRTGLAPCDSQGPLLGHSRAFQAALELLSKAAPTQVTVLLTGETGVGKERFARALHAMSPRADKPFVAVNCAALPADLIESELFGAEKGAFTGATATRIGRFERAHGGTLMLDELGELPLAAQAKLLRVLQSGEVERLGGHRSTQVDVRVIAATNVDLEKAVEQGRFRRDLLYRLNVYPIRIPALRERVDDIELLAMHLLQKYSALHGKAAPGFSDRALTALRGHSWPGNVRELENLVERGLILTPAGEPIDVACLFPQWSDNGQSTIDDQGHLAQACSTDGDLHTASVYDSMQHQGLSLDALEDGLLQEAVRRASGNLAAAARALGMTRPQLSYRLSRIRERTTGTEE